MTILVFDTRPFGLPGIRLGEEPSVDDDLDEDADNSDSMMGSTGSDIGSGSITTIGSSGGSGAGVVLFNVGGCFFAGFFGGGATFGAFFAGGGARCVLGLVDVLSLLNEVGTTPSGFSSSSMDSGVLMKSNWSKKFNCVALLTGDAGTWEWSVKSAEE